MKKGRPKSVFVLALVDIIFGLFMIFIMGLTTFPYRKVDSIYLKDSIIFFLIGILALFSGVGLMRLWNWVRVAKLTMSYFSVAAFIFDLYQMSRAETLTGSESFIIYLPLSVVSIASIYFLSRSHVKDAFK